MIPQPYPLWYATSDARAGRVIAWLNDGNNVLVPVVAFPHRDGTIHDAAPDYSGGWLGATFAEATQAARAEMVKAGRAQDGALAPDRMPANPDLANPGPGIEVAVVRPQDVRPQP